MTGEGPHGGPDDGRHESPLGRLDRHWAELLQEVRVVQTGVQVLTGFLLTVPFQQRFDTLQRPEQIVLLCAVGLCAGSTAAMIAPVALHRTLFRRKARRQLIGAAQRLAIAGLWMLGLAISAVVGLIFDVVLNRVAGLVAGSVTLTVFVVLWVVVPMLMRGQLKADKSAGHPE